MIQSPFVTMLLSLLFSPIGPALILLAGAAAEIALGRWFRRAQWHTWFALAFLAIAGLLYIGLQFSGVVPTLRATLAKAVSISACDGDML